VRHSRHRALADLALVTQTQRSCLGDTPRVDDHTFSFLKTEEQTLFEDSNMTLQDTMEEKVSDSDLGASTWVVTLKLHRLAPWVTEFNVCKASLLVNGTSDEGGGDEEMLRTTVKVNPTFGDIDRLSSSEETLEETMQLQDEPHDVTELGDSDEPDNNSNLETIAQVGDSSNGSSPADTEPTTEYNVEDGGPAEEFPEAETATVLQSERPRDFLLDLVKLDGLSSWNNEVVAVFVGKDRIKFIVPTFLLTRNFGFFRATLEEHRWAESANQVITLPEESPVDFVLLLRFIVHNRTEDFNNVLEPWYPFGPRSYPYDVRRLHTYETKLAPWLFRLVAMAERLCFSFPSSRLTNMLGNSLELRDTDRVSPPLLDWVFKHTMNGSVLREFVYGRVFTSLLSGDVSLVVYQPYLEENVKPSGMASFLLKQYRNKILSEKNAYLKSEHVWKNGYGWTGCDGVCLTCWSKDLGDLPDELARVLVDRD
jgi:hypothetical protein